MRQLSMSGYDFFNRIRPDPGFVSPVRSDSDFVSPVRSDPGFMSPVRSDAGFVSPIRSDPVRSDPGFVNGQLSPLVEVKKVSRLMWLKSSHLCRSYWR